MTYAPGRRGSMRYFFAHGNHERTQLLGDVAVTAKIVVFHRHGKIVYGGIENSSTFCFTDGAWKNESPLPAHEFTERLISHVSVPTLIVAEVPRAILVEGRSDRPSCNPDDRYYLNTMLDGFVPYFIESISLKSSDYLPGDVHNLSKEVSIHMNLQTHGEEFAAFLQLYRQRYFSNQPVESAMVLLASCLLHILKMPFDFETSILQGLM
ncbi:uncharacterized protein N7483_003002 [Penicillium malachiteum]|uniref:uncharacterized protein n=1 Tax=Penicillium malachiteum TaxID=1324776 RepID=UPI002546B0CE|nr:uncharacterized protein N7483_003002 [Penicillium malachiteum]KAJ5737877.1 hypothetical protein N7483_003002 [Penicillium malachiteum]